MSTSTSHYTKFQFLKSGEIQVREGKKGLEFFAFNHEHKKPLHVGTLCGLTYEKTVPLLRKPEPSFCLPTSELAAIEQAGGKFIRFIARGLVGTYAIALDDFKLHGERYFARSYGYQIRVPLSCPKFAYSSKTQNRNPVVDNPPVETVQPIIKREKQLTLNGWGM